MNFESFGLANFKAFGPILQSVPIKPITLVFGPNSSGKSSLLHGLVWAAEAMEQKSFDIRSSKRVSETLDLGGFQSVVRKHDPQNKVTLSIGVGSIPSGVPVRIILEIGIRTENDSWEIYKQEWLKPHPDWNEIEEFNMARHVVDKTHDLFNNAFNFGSPSTAQVEAALATDAAWEHVLELLRRYEEEEEMNLSELPVADEARRQYREAQRAWERQRELAPKVIALLKILRESFEKIDAIENRNPTLLSCKVLAGDEVIFSASRKLSSSSLTVAPGTYAQIAWKEILSQNHSDKPQVGPQTPPIFVSKCFGSIEFVRPSLNEFPSDPEPLHFDEALHWLVARLDSFAEQMTKLLVVGPLRALPSRKDLLAFPSDTTSDPLLRPWLRLRDDERVLDSVNRSLKALTRSHLSFWRASYGRIRRLIDIEDEMPEDRTQMQTICGGRVGPTNWHAQGFMDGYTMNSTDLMVITDGPFYKEVKDDDPLLAVRLVERLLVRQHPQEILFDLLLRDDRTGVDVKPQDVGVGISQITPVLVNAYGNDQAFIAIEQPEVHVHPALQAELGDVFIESALGPHRNIFLIETHSEHLILRILRRIRETTEGEIKDWPDALREACPNGIRPEDVAVLYVKPGEDGAQVEPLRINELGEFVDEWPGGFFDERIREIL